MQRARDWRGDVIRRRAVDVEESREARRRAGIGEVHEQGRGGRRNGAGEEEGDGFFHDGRDEISDLGGV